MRALIDGDVLRYEIGACGQYVNDDEELVVRPFDFVQELLDNKIKDICAAVWATEPPLLFLTMDYRTKKRQNKRKAKQVKKLEKELKREDTSTLELGCIAKEIETIQKSMEYKPNFREAVAKKKVYKGTRKNEKPRHYDNLTEYILSKYECVMAEGLEADDLLSIHQTEQMAIHSGEPTTVICSRDKDLRITPGLHYGWECGRQREFPLNRVSERGVLTCHRNDAGRVVKVAGTGLSFFCHQLLVGDTVDNIPGLSGWGQARAADLLEGLESKAALLKAVANAYRDQHPDDWEEVLLEQGRLLHMVNTRDGDFVKMWSPPWFEYEEWLNVKTKEVKRVARVPSRDWRIFLEGLKGV